jgi:hypothetical protein
MSNMERMRKQLLNELILEVQGEEFIIHPIKGDKLRLAQKLSSVSEDDTSAVMNMYLSVLLELFVREEERSGETLSDDDKQKLELWIDDNINTLVEQLLVKWRIISKESIEEEKNKRLKKKPVSNPPL